jgi:hypothetical protein
MMDTVSQTEHFTIRLYSLLHDPAALETCASKGAARAAVEFSAASLSTSRFLIFCV